jgi:hypothetical protein
MFAARLAARPRASMSQVKKVVRRPALESARTTAAAAAIAPSMLSGRSQAVSSGSPAVRASACTWEKEITAAVAATVATPRMAVIRPVWRGGVWVTTAFRSA